LKNRKVYCDHCGGNYCVDGYSSKRPDYCVAAADQRRLDLAAMKYRLKGAERIQFASTRIQKRQLDERHFWPRFKEAIEFARELHAEKIGIAVCNSMLDEARTYAGLLKQAGLRPITVTCMAGGMRKDQLNIPAEWEVPACNPILQAEILNDENTDLNLLYGLCMGHDTLFMMHSIAPVTVVVVKDRVTVNNPGAVIHSPYHMKQLREAYQNAHEQKDEESPDQPPGKNI